MCCRTQPVPREEALGLPTVLFPLQWPEWGSLRGQYFTFLVLLNIMLCPWKAFLIWTTGDWQSWLVNRSKDELLMILSQTKDPTAVISWDYLWPKPGQKGKEGKEVLREVWKEVLKEGWKGWIKVESVEPLAAWGPTSHGKVLRRFARLRIQCTV